MNQMRETMVSIKLAYASVITRVGGLKTYKALPVKPSPIVSDRW